mgnify:CR=1 FL=1
MCSSQTTVVNLKYEAFDVRIDRKTRWGNPFPMRSEADRDRVCEEYRAWLWGEIKANRITLEDIADLRGKRLGCHCAPRRCHGDTLAAAADWAWQKLQAA